MIKGKGISRLVLAKLYGYYHHLDLKVQRSNFIIWSFLFSLAYLVLNLICASVWEMGSKYLTTNERKKTGTDLMCKIELATMDAPI